MAIAKTKTITKLVFFPLAVVGAGFTLKLFFEFGDNIVSSIAWAIVGAGMEALKLIFLLRWQTAVFLKKRPKVINIVGYLSLALLCALASLVFGITTIERQSLKGSAATAKAQELRIRIQDTEARISNLAISAQSDDERQSIKKQISALTRQIDQITVNVSERSIALTQEIERLQARLRSFGYETIDNRKETLLQALGQLRKEYAEVALSESSTKGSFETIAATIGVKQDTVMVWFLFFVVLAMEVGMAVTSGGAIFGDAGKKVGPKMKDKAQLKFEGIK